MNNELHSFRRRVTRKTGHFEEVTLFDWIVCETTSRAVSCVSAILLGDIQAGTINAPWIFS